MDYRLQGIIFVSTALTCFLAGRFSIPYFRKIKTGKFDFYIGDRFAQDGSEPKFGGGVMAIPLALGLAVGGSFGGVDIKLVLTGAVLALMLMTLGMYEDYLKETKRGIGIKAGYMVLSEFVLCLGYLMLKGSFGMQSTGVLLPFRLGYLEMGMLYYPITALFMTLVINAVKHHDCIGGAVDKSVQGLMPLSCFIYSLGFLSGGSLNGGCPQTALFAICTAGVCFGFLVWSVSPSKIYPGESGGLLLGGLLAVMTELSGIFPVFLVGGIVLVIDAGTEVLQLMTYKVSKKFLLKGLTLHEHLSRKGWDDYKIMGAFSLVSLIGAVGTVMYFVYKGKILIEQ